MDKRIKISWIITLLLHGSCYFVPFLSQDMGAELFWEGIEALLRGRIRVKELPIFFAFYTPLFFLVLMVFFYWSKHPRTYTVFWKRIFFFFLCCPTLLAAFFVVQKESRENLIGILGFVGWALSFWVLFVLYCLQKRTKREDEKDILEHLVD